MARTALFVLAIACILCSLLFSCASALSAEVEKRTLLNVELSSKLFEDKICLTWGYEEARRLGMLLYLPPRFDAVFASGDPINVSRAMEGGQKTNCPDRTTLADWLKSKHDQPRIDVFVKPSSLPPLPRSISSKKPFYHLHATGTINFTADGFLLEKAKEGPLVVTCDYAHTTEAGSTALFSKLDDLGLDVLDLCQGSTHLPDPKVIAAIAMQSTLFFAFTNTDVSAYALQERRRHHLWSAELIFSENSVTRRMYEESAHLPWIFTYNDASPSYDYMLKALVRSAQGGSHAFCLFSGDFKSPVALWLVENNVKLMSHTPLWGDQFWEKVLPFREENIKHSHLYASKVMVVGTWQRIDIPTIHDMTQFRYMLFTDSDVFFHALPSYTDILDLSPEIVSMGPEMQDFFPYNAGVMVMNMRNLYHTYKDFLAFILSNKFGLYFPNYGPGDQGAYNEFYEQPIRRDVLPKIFNSKPYQDYNKETKIVHFHGPKPIDYHTFFATGNCRFGGMCHDGLTKGLCQYVGVWAPFCLEPECANYILSCSVMRSMCQQS